jgi:hypothetical protein
VSSFFCSQSESQPAHLRVTQAVRQPRAKAKSSLNREFRFIVEFGKENSSLGLVNFFSGGVGKFFFLVHFGSGFQIIGSKILFGLFNFRFAVGQSSR